METNQVFSLANSIAKQMWGSESIDVVDTSSLVSMGEDVLRSNTSKETYLNTLVDRIGKTLIRTLKSKSYAPNLVKTTFEWGCILQKVDIEPLEAQRDKSWDIGNPDFGTATLPSDYLKIFKPKITQKFFKSRNAVKNTVTIPDFLFEDSFTNAQTYGLFVEGVMKAQKDVIERTLNNTEMLCIDHFIASKIHEGNGVYNLLPDYNTAHPNATLTAVQAMETPAFLKYAGKVMRDVIGYMDDESVRFNAYGKVRRTTRDDMHVFIHRDFASAYATYLESDTFHKELIALPLYQEVNKWQGTGKAQYGDFKDRTSIKITIGKVEDSTADNYGEDITINQSGIVGFFADTYALGVTNLKEHAGADRNNGEGYTNYTQGATFGYFNDLSENGVVFIVADPKTETTSDETTH